MATFCKQKEGHLTVERVRELFNYDPETGFLTFRMKRGPRSAGARAGSRAIGGYRPINIERKVYREHRVIWLHYYGEWPPYDVDHRDRNRSNNRIANLRSATRSNNLLNSFGRKNLTTGLKGVYFDRRSDRAGPRPYMAWIQQSGKRKIVGYYATVQEAHAARTAAAIAAYGEFALIQDAQGNQVETPAF